MADLSINFQEQAQGTALYRDLLMLNGDLVMTSDVNPAGTDPVLQQIAQRLRFFLGEWFMNNTIGVPWFQQLLAVRNNLDVLDAVLQNVVLGTPGVIQLTYWHIVNDASNRVLTLTFTAATTTGTVSYRENLDPSSGSNA